MDPNAVQAVTSNSDLNGFFEALKMVPVYLGSAAALIASIAALRGINAWKREFQGKKKIELAEEALTLFYEASDAIRRIRSPLSNSDEGRSRIPEKQQSEYMDKKVPHVFVVLERFEREEHIFNKISAMRYRFMAVFGNDSEAPFSVIRTIINDIFVAARMYGIHGEMRHGTVGEDDSERLREENAKNMRIIWNVGKDDTIGQRVNKAIEELESICRPVILNS